MNVPLGLFLPETRFVSPLWQHNYCLKEIERYGIIIGSNYLLRWTLGQWWTEKNRERNTVIVQGRTCGSERFRKIKNGKSHEKSQKEKEVGFGLREVVMVCSLLMLTSWCRDSLVNITNHFDWVSSSEQSTWLATEPVSHDGVGGNREREIIDLSQNATIATVRGTYIYLKTENIDN